MKKESINIVCDNEDPRLPSQVWVWDGEVCDEDPKPGVGFSKATKYIRADAYTSLLQEVINRCIFEHGSVRDSFHKSLREGDTCSTCDVITRATKLFPGLDPE